MAGRFDRLFLYLLSVLVLAAAIPSTARTETVHGQSRELKIDFTVAGGTRWCGPLVRVLLTASATSAFAPDTIPFLQMVGRVRAVLQSLCPTIENIRFEGRTDNRLVFAAETLRLTKWRRLIELNPATGRPSCPPDTTSCTSQVEAYLIAQALLRGESFQATELTGVLEPGNEGLTLRSNGVIGKLRVVPREQVAGEFATPAAFASAVVRSLEANCKSSGGRSKAVRSKDFKADIAQRSVGCKQPDRTGTQNIVLVWSSSANYAVLSLWGEGPGRGRAFDFASRLVRAIQRSR